MSNVKRLPQKVEEDSGDLDIANMWSGENSIILKIDDRTEGTISEALHRAPRSRIDFTSMEGICLFASELSNVQNQGMDRIPNEFYIVVLGFIYT